MTRSQQHPDSQRDNRTRIALAALTGLLAGTARAVTSWLLSHFSA